MRNIVLLCNSYFNIFWFRDADRRLNVVLSQQIPFHYVDCCWDEVEILLQSYRRFINSYKCAWDFENAKSPFARKYLVHLLSSSCLCAWDQRHGELYTVTLGLSTKALCASGPTRLEPIYYSVILIPKFASRINFSESARKANPLNTDMNFLWLPTL